MLTSELHDLERRIAGDPEVERLQLELAACKERMQEASLRLRDMDRLVEGHRERARSREAELMSGKIRNPTELMQMSQEVEHAKATVRDEEDRELELMSEAEEAEKALAAALAAVDQAERSWQGAQPDLERRLESARGELAAAEAERDRIWGEMPAPYRAAYERLSTRVSNPVAEVAGGQCGACRVALTASELQQVRRSEQLLNCQNCGRILVAV